MAITDKARKILWGRSGNRCAICRHELVVNATPADDESVVGEECHIISGKSQGPRYDPEFPADRVDEPENLILLCRTHHKVVDDQFQTYTVDTLSAQKEKHEKWVSSTLTGDKPVAPIRVLRVKDSIPTFLARLTSGRALLAVLDGAHGYLFDHDEPRSEVEMELIKGFLQEAKDWGEASSVLEAGDRVEAAFCMSKLLTELEQAGFWVFAGREVRRVEGGVGPPSPFPVAILSVLRPTNPEIIKIDFNGKADQREDQQSGSDERNAAFLKIERQLPDLLAEMRNDIAQNPLRREFVLLKNKASTYWAKGNELAYYYEEHSDLESKVRILQNLGLIDDIAFNDVPRYVITEEFADYLAKKD